MTREELIKKVALKMDEISSSDDVVVNVGVSDNNPLYTQINSLLNESVNEVLMKAPVYRLDSQIIQACGGSGYVDGAFTNIQPKSLITSEIKMFDDTRLIARIVVPEDFLRLVSISDPSFQRPIVDLALEGDDVDKRQHNKFLVAKSAKPVAVISGISGAKTITCYSYDADSKPSLSMQYIKRYDNDEDTSADIDLDSYLIDVVSWVCAGKVFDTQGDVNKAKTCGEAAVSLMA